MKKILFIALFLISNLILAQGNPNPFPRGIDTKFVKYQHLTTTQKLALPQTEGTVVYDVTLKELQVFNGTDWVASSADLTPYLLSATAAATYKPLFSENTGFNKNFGTTSGTVAEGNDSRVLNGQTAFGWGNWSTGVNQAFVEGLGFNTGAHFTPSLSGLATNDLLKWNGANWVNTTVAGLNLVNRTATNYMTSGSVLDFQVGSQLRTFNVPAFYNGIIIGTTTINTDENVAKDNFVLKYDFSTNSINLEAESGGGSSTFAALTDTPSSYTGQAGKLARVNTGATGLEFASIFDGLSSYGSAVNLSDGILFRTVASSSPLYLSVSSLPFYRAGNFIAGTNYQVPLVSATNIKTVNGTSLLGSGDLVVSGGSGDDVSTFSEKSGALVGSDRLVGLSGATDFSETISGIPLSIFNNDLGITSNVTHTSEVTGATDLTVQPIAISNKTSKTTLAGTEEVLINDGGTLKKATTQAIADLVGTGSADVTPETFTGTGVETSWTVTATPRASHQLFFSSGGSTAVLFVKDVDYSLSGNTFTFLTNTPLGLDSVLIYYPSVSGLIIDNSTGGGNPNIVIVNTVTDFVGINKTFSIQGTFTLTENLTLPNGALLVDGGGIMTLSTYSLLGNIKGFHSDTNNTFINIGLNGVIDDSMTFEEGNIDLNWFGLVADGNFTTNTGTDNRNIILQGIKPINYASGIGTISKSGKYMTSAILGRSDITTTPSNIYFTNGASFITNKDAWIGMLTNELSGYYFVELWKNTGGKFAFNIHGDWATRTTKTEGGHGFVIGHGNRFVTVKDVKIEEFIGYGATGAADPGFYYNGFFVESEFTKNFTIDATGTAVANTEMAYSSSFDVSNSQFRTYGMQLCGGAYAGSPGLEINQYQVAFYNNTTFISKTGYVETYESIPIPAAANKAVLLIHQPYNWANLELTVASFTHSYGTKIEGMFIDKCANQGISNIPPNSLVEGIRFGQNGYYADGTPGSPGFDWDDEDFYQGLSKKTLRDIIFGNSKGGAMIIKGVRDLTIENCVFPYPNIPGAVSVRAVDFINGERNIFQSNTVRGWDLGLGRGSTATGNNLLDVQVYFSEKNEYFTNHTIAINTKLSKVLVDAGSDVAYVKNNQFNYNRLNNIAVFRNTAHVIFENNVFDFKVYTYSNAGTAYNLTYGGTKLISSQTEEELARGGIKNFKIINLSLQSGEEWENAMPFPLYDTIEDFDICTSMSITSGLTQNATIKNGKIYGRLEFVLSYFPTTNSGTFNTITIEDVEIAPPTNAYMDWLETSLIITRAKDVNIYFKNDVFKMPSGSNKSKWFDGLHYGTTVFDGSDFSSVDAGSVFDLTGKTCGNVTFKNCDFNNVSVVLRAGDRMKYSIPNVNCPSYADNATALTALGEGWYYKLTSTGEFKITY